MSTVKDLVEAVDRLNETEKEYRKTRTEVADLLKQASLTVKVTDLARLTGINRATIYWLMKAWSSIDEDRNNNYDSSQSA